MDRTDTDIAVAIIAAGATLLGGGALAALITARFQRKQHYREMLLPPAQLFAEAVVTAFARLRTVKPPTRREHRNFRLLSDPPELERRLDACRAAIDEVRVARGAVRVVLPPTSDAVANVGRAVYAQRLMLETCEDFYRDCKVRELGKRKPHAVERLWKEHEPQASDLYRALRVDSGWASVNQFGAEVQHLLRKPRWGKASELPVPQEPDEVRASARKPVRSSPTPSTPRDAAR